VNELGRLWVESANVALSLVDDAQVQVQWTDPSSLPQMTVGALAGHLLHSGILMVEEAFAITEVPAGQPITATRMLSWVPLDNESPVHDGVRSVAESQTIEGRQELVERVRASLKRSETALSNASPSLILAFSWAPSLSMTLSEFLRSRILELVVHGDDLVHSVGIEQLPFERDAIDLACHLGIDINIQRYGSSAVLRSLFRRDRNSLDALRTF
jgi:hypothetical protein